MELGPTLIHLRDFERDKIQIIRKCQEWGLLPHERTYMCPKCGNALQLGISARSLDGYRWNCNSSYIIKKRKRQKCNTRISLRSKTFFEKSRLSLKQILGFASMWIRGCTQQYICFELTMNQTTAVDWASFCREVTYISMMEKKEKIGGVGKTVEIDVAKFAKWKFHVGRMPRDNWVFGCVEKESGKVFMKTVKDRSVATLIALINKWIEPGTTIYSNCWKASSDINNLGFDHKTVNHSFNFVDPDTGIHTKSIESAWNAAKISVTQHNRKPNSLSGNLARHMLIKKAKAEGLDPVLLFYKMAGELYNPLSDKIPDTATHPQQGNELEGEDEDNDDVNVEDKDVDDEDDDDEEND